MDRCPDCRYCSDGVPAVAAQGRLPRPTEWFEQPCPSCHHRLRAHETGVPRGAVVAGALSGAHAAPS